jgi:hypothetical protein
MCEFVVLFAYRTNLGIQSVLSMQLENSGPKARRKRNTCCKNTLTDGFPLAAGSRPSKFERYAREFT